MKSLFFIFSLTICVAGFGQTPGIDPHWQLLWEDNFDSLNTNIWQVQNNFDHYGGIAVYTNRTDNVFIDNGSLVLRMKNESYHCTDIYFWACNSEWYDYTSGWIETKPAYYPQFGYIEARIKLPYGNGLWPAFWTFSGTAGYQEIDIFEMIPGAVEYCHRNTSQQFYHTNHIMTSNVHLQPPDGTCDDPYDHGSVMYIDDYTQWHTYAIEWSPGKIVFYLDGSPVKFYQNSQVTAPTMVVLNLAINPYVNLNSGFPADMKIDFVRVYELKKECTDNINSVNYDFSTYNNKLKNFILIGGDGSINSLSSTDNITLRASQYIDLAGDFTVPLGASFFADAGKDCPQDLISACTQTFNPCTFNFNNYDNSIKKSIDLGTNGCSMNIIPVTNNILLGATNQIILRSGVSITPVSGKSVKLKIVSCN